MPQISFTPRNSAVYDRFSRLLLKEQLKRGKLTAPQFLDLVLDAFEKRQVVIEANEWNDSKVVLPTVGDKLLVEFPNGKTHRAIYYEDNGFDVYLEEGEGVSKSGFYPFSRMTCIRWKLNDFKEPEKETE